jgi:hypothetical protein
VCAAASSASGAIDSTVNGDYRQRVASAST